MHSTKLARFLFVSLLAAMTLVWTVPAWAQGGFGFGGGGQPKVQASAQFTVDGGGQTGRLFVTAKIEPGWHIYSITQTGRGPIKTELTVPDGQGIELLGPFQAYPAPDVKIEELFDNLAVESHHDKVTWHAPIRFAPGANPGNLKIRGTVRAQPCSDTSCLPPQDFAFTATLGSGEKVPAEQLATPSAAATPSQSPIRPSPFEAKEEPTSPEAVATDRVDAQADSMSSSSASGGELRWHPYTNMEDFSAIVSTNGIPFDPEQVSANLKKVHESRTLPLVLLGAFIGGIILNLMPCVLPVIGLKVLSFVSQAGESRSRAFTLNVVYSIGIVSVFMLLAALAVGLGLGWGQLFSYAEFNVAMTAVVFAMGLSFLGVWEIPIPGFVGSGKAAEVQQKEGLSAAFLKGVITTILATPCTGPFMASALTWAVAQPPGIVFSVFLAIGLGMSSPYLLIGAFPELIRFLPKPGAWMDTFKQVMGFFLLGTVVFLLSFLKWPYVVPTVGLLFAIWGGLWWFNRTPITATSGAKWRAWLEGTAFAGVAWLLLFPGLDGIVPGRFGIHGLFDEMNDRYLALVEDHAPTTAAVPDEPRTVLVDFTADWCTSCKYFEKVVLEDPEVVEAFKRDDVVLLKADYTHQPPEIKRFLNVLRSDQVPVVAVFSPDNPNDPKVFLGGYTKDNILSALEEARPKS